MCDMSFYTDENNEKPRKGKLLGDIKPEKDLTKIKDFSIERLMYQTSKILLHEVSPMPILKLRENGTLTSSPSGATRPHLTLKTLKVAISGMEYSRCQPKTRSKTATRTPTSVSWRFWRIGGTPCPDRHPRARRMTWSSRRTRTAKKAGWPSTRTSPRGLCVGG